MEEVEQIKKQIATGNTENAIERLKSIISQLEEEINTSSPIEAKSSLAEYYVLLGNAHRKNSAWKQALDHYQRAIDLDPTSTAVDARKHLIDILNFYHKDMFNH